MTNHHPRYITQLNAFHRWLGSHYLPANARLLWFMLIGLFNASGWEEWVSISTAQLMHLIDTPSDKTAFRARKKLIDAGLLVYESGKKAQPCRYRLVWFPESSVTHDGENDADCDGDYDGENVPYVTEKTTIMHTNNKRIEKEKDKEKEDSLLSAEADAKKRQRCDCAEIVDRFNRICVSLPRVQTLSDKRRKAIRAASGTVEDCGGWEKLFGTVEQSDFLTGRSGTWNGCGFDWILKPANLVKILEGNYADKNTRKEKAYDESLRIATTV